MRNKVSARFLADFLRIIALINEQTYTIKTPVAIWYGAEDRIVEPWVSSDLYARLGCRSEKLEVVAGAYHEVLFEKNGQRVAACVRTTNVSTRKAAMNYRHV